MENQTEELSDAKRGGTFQLKVLPLRRSVSRRSVTKEKRKFIRIESHGSCQRLTESVLSVKFFFVLTSDDSIKNMYCLNCGTKIEKAGYCIHCSPTIPPTQKYTITPPERHGLSTLQIVIVVLITVFGLVLLVNLGIALYEQIGQSQTQRQPPVNINTATNKVVYVSPERSVNTTNQTTNYQPPERSAKPQNLIDDAFHLAAQEKRSYPFTITESSHIVGGFTAEGGGRNDAQCVIIDAFELQNLKNGNQYKVYYDSGIATVGKINVNLAAGSYDIVFINSAFFESKTVKAKFTKTDN